MVDIPVEFYGKNENSKEKMVELLERIIAKPCFEHFAVVNPYKGTITSDDQLYIHECNRVSLVLDGCLQLECGEDTERRPRSFPRGTVLVMKPYSLTGPHWEDAHKGREIFGLVCRPNYLRLMYSNNCPDGHPVVVCDYYYHISDTVRQGTLDAIAALSSLMEGEEANQIFVPLMTAVCTMILNDLKASQVGIYGRAYNLWERILEYLAESPLSQRTRRQVSRQFHITEVYLSRLFRKYSGMSFTDYLRKEAIRKAVVLLETTDLSIKEIAMTCGFCSASHFISSFRKAHQVSPVKWRQMRPHPNRGGK
ncbi:MAG: helix-turn-helix transcriptional regulator [Victivallales bacterium]|nr:helix-turn-helix transcriptional regulator [Victivallales bacterium]